jgi:hypothetical protein
MHEPALRTVLLIRSIDEGDKSGQVLSLDERNDATLAAAKGAPVIASGLTGPSLPAAAEGIMVRRAELLLAKLRSRSPVIDRVLDLADGVSWLGPVVLGVAFFMGVGVSALNGSQRIEILAFPVFGLLLWNLLVYVALIALAVRARRKPKPVASRLSGFYARVLRGRAQALLRDTARFNVPLTEVMQNFANEWVSVVRTSWQLRTTRLLHMSALVLAFGCIVGLYVRGLVLRYDAGWESTFLDAGQVRTLMGVIYGPASAFTGISLPSEAEVEALRWKDTVYGAPAADFIHLIAVTVALYVGIPRLIAWIVCSLQLWQQRRSPQLPASFMPYARKILVQTGRVTGMRAHVYSYAYEPSTDALAGLTALLADALGGEVKCEVRASIAYGEEDNFVERIAAEPLAHADCYVLLMSLSSTPESENHGALISALKRALQGRGTGLIVLVDESPYAARMGDDPALAPRRAERTRSWRDFVTQLGDTACIAELRQLRPGVDASAGASREVRAALQRAEQA